VKRILLFIIRGYWLLIPESKRRKCIFNKSCSNHVYDELQLNGLRAGLRELLFRIRNCQPEFDIFTDYKTGRQKMLLKTGIIVDESQIAERLRK
jgi:putative component of membrane protein insertase Oxa1/YidC/SpoIIIJ protein YidD